MPEVQQPRYLPTVLCGIDGEGPVYVLASRAANEAEAIALAVDDGVMSEPDDGEMFETRRVLMRELDPIACKIRGVDEGWWDECTTRAKYPVEFWKIDV